MLRQAEKFIPYLNKLALVSGAVGAVGFGVYSSLYTVEGGQRALIFDRLRDGTQPEPKPPGTHFLIPGIQYPIFYDTRITPFRIQAETPSRDLQTVNITLRVLFRPAEDKLQYIYKRLGIDYSEKVFGSVAIQTLKDVVANYEAKDLITRRQVVSEEIEKLLLEQTEYFGVVLEDISITHLHFSPEYTRAIEHKQVAQQNAERSKFIVAKTEQEKLAKVIRAEGEAEAAELMRQAQEYGDGYIALRRIEAAKEIAQTLGKSRNVTYLPGGGSNVLLNLDKA